MWSKNAAELCALLVDETFGELPSRIEATLLSRGRLTLHQLAQETALSLRQLRHGLVVLMQHNLLYHYVDPATKAASYEANPAAAYNLLRVGKILDVAETTLGKGGREGREVLEHVMLIGQARVGDLYEIFGDRIRRQKSTKDGSDQRESLTRVKSLDHLTSVVAALAEADFLEVVTDHSFQSPKDIYRDVEKRIIATSFPGGARGSKQKMELQSKIYEAFEEIRERSRALKRKLADPRDKVHKKQKILMNGDISHGLEHPALTSPLDDQAILRVNLQKCMVELRNQKLTDLVADRIGITTSRVYATLLHLVSQAIGRCRSDDVLEMMGQNGDLGLEQEGVSTSDILNHLDVSVDLSCGIGKATSASIDRRLAESLQPRRLGHSAGHDEAQVLGDASSDEASGSDTSGASDDEIVQRPPLNGAHPKTKLNGIARVSTDSSTLSTGREGRLNQLRQHLLLLCEGQHIFVRHSSDDEWTVDFRPLLRRFQDAELDIVIEETSGRYGLRLAHILRKNGKLDEKNLPHIALMKKAAVQNKMLEMQMAGFVDIQEIPRDNNRTANRTMFLWFTDSERCLDQLLENTYKSMLRTLQILQVQRKQDREVLGLAERQDVRGREEEIMQATTYNAFIQHKEIEGKLLNQIMRLDDLVAVLRDF